MKKGLIKHGTLILAALCRDGVVLSADKGGELEHVGPLRNQDKLFDLGNNAHLAACGAVKVVNPKDFSEDWFNVITITRDYFRRTQLTNDEGFWEGLKNRIKEEFEDYLGDSNPDQEIDCTLVFFFQDHENKIRHKKVTLIYDGQNEASIDVDQLWPKGLYGAYGHRAVAYGLLKDEPRLASLRTHPAIKPFIKKGNSPSDVSLDQALIFIRKVMEASSQLLPSRGYVSREFDYVVLKGAFQFTPLE